MESVPDHPAIRNALLTGYPNRVSGFDPVCPSCGEALDPDDFVYSDAQEDIVGCEFCLRRLRAAEGCETYERLD